MDLPVQAIGSGRFTKTDGTVAGPDYIQALGIPNLVGRDISVVDITGARASAVINRKLAAKL